MQRVKDFNWNKNGNFKRAGIIPYIENNGVRFYAFGIENHIAAMCDFGGHIEDDDYDILDSAMREYHEESFSIFGDLTRENLQNSFVINSNESIEILYKVNGNMFDYVKKFHDKLTDRNHEIQNIVWLSRRQLITVIDNQDFIIDDIRIFHFYNKVHQVLKLNLNNL